MTIRVDSSPLIASRFVVGTSGLGVPAEDIPTSGEAGGSVFANDISLPADNGKEIRGLILTTPGVGNFGMDEYGRVTFTGAPDGVYTATYQLYVDGVSTGAPATITMIIGGYTMSSDAGSYVQTGTSVGLLADRTISSLAGSYAVTGTDVGLTLGVVESHDSGSYSVTGTSVSFLHNKMLGAAAGSLALTGTDVTLTPSLLTSYTVGTDSGSYSLTGTDLAFNYSGSLIPNSWTTNVIYHSGAVIPQAPDKDPDSTIDYGFDWTDKLDDGETVSTSTWILESGITGSSSNIFGNKTHLLLSGGSVGYTYIATNRINTSEGRTIDRSMKIRVREK